MANSIKNNKNTKSKKGQGSSLLKIIIVPLLIVAFVAVYFLFLQPGYKILYQDSENETIFLSLYVNDTASNNLININDKLYDKYKSSYSSFSFNYFDDKDAAASIYLIMTNDTGEVRQKALEHNFAVFLKNKDHNCLLKKTKDVPVTLKCY